jgi:hypothetical protein
VSEPIDCPRLRDVWALWDGELECDLSTELQAHLAGCRVCRAEQEEWARVAGFLRAGDPSAPQSPERRSALKKALIDACARSLARTDEAATRVDATPLLRRRRWTLPRLGLALAALAAAMLLVLLLRVAPPRPHPPQVVHGPPQQDRRPRRPYQTVTAPPVGPRSLVGHSTERKHPVSGPGHRRHGRTLHQRERRPSVDLRRRGGPPDQVTRPRRLLHEHPVEGVLSLLVGTPPANQRLRQRPEPPAAPSRLVIDVDGRPGAPAAATRSITIVARGDTATSAKGFALIESHSEEVGP